MKYVVIFILLAFFISCEKRFGPRPNPKAALERSEQANIGLSLNSLLQEDSVDQKSLDQIRCALTELGQLFYDEEKKSIIFKYTTIYGHYVAIATKDGVSFYELNSCSQQQ